LWQSHRRPCAQGSLAAATAAHGQPLFTVKPEQLLVVQHDPLAPQQDVQTPIAKPPSLAGEGAQPFPDRRVVASRRGIAVGLRRKADQHAGAPL